MKATKLNVMAMIALGSVMALAPMTRAEEKKDDEAKPKAPQRERASRPQDRMHRIAEELKLTDEQKPKFEAAMKEQSEKLQAIGKNADLSTEDKRTKVREVRREGTAKMKNILDADQFAKWEKLRQGGARARGVPGEKPPGEKPAGDKTSADK